MASKLSLEAYWSNRGFDRCHRHRYAILAPSWSSSFFHHFSNTLLYRCWLDFGPQLGVKIPPKSVLKLIFSTSEVTSSDFQDFEGCLTRFTSFCGPSPSPKASKIHKKSRKLILKRQSILLQFLDSLFYRFL